MNLIYGFIFVFHSLCTLYPSPLSPVASGVPHKEKRREEKRREEKRREWE